MTQVDSSGKYTADNPPPNYMEKHWSESKYGCACDGYYHADCKAKRKRGEKSSTYYCLNCDWTGNDPRHGLDTVHGIRRREPLIVNVNIPSYWIHGAKPGCTHRWAFRSGSMNHTQYKCTECGASGKIDTSD